MTKVAEVFGCNTFSDIQHFLAGVECELEACLQQQPIGIFNPVPDGSLRNNGLEYVSAPADKKNLIQGFANLHKTIKFKAGVDPFSVRTSTHVHVNCQSLSAEDARTMVLLYALFEEFFFMMVKPVRRNNIHCVPLTETAMPALYKKPITLLAKAWHKYTALNLKRLMDLGTMEFRHLHGTGDVAEFTEWLNVLDNLWTLCQRVTISEETLTKQNIMVWFETLFQTSPTILAYRTSVFDIIRNSLIDVKFSV